MKDGASCGSDAFAMLPQGPCVLETCSEPDGFSLSGADEV